MPNRHLLYSKISLMVALILACISGCSGHQDVNQMHGEASKELRNFQVTEAADKLKSYTPLVALIKKGRVEGYYASEADAKQAAANESNKNIQILDASRTRLPIKRAMELVIADRASPMTKPEPIAGQKPFVPDAPVALAPVPQLELKPELVAQGEAIFNNPAKMCATCHSVDGTKKTGPSMKGLWGSVEKLEGGVEVRFDQAYFTRSIKEPPAQVVQGYPPTMPQLPISDEEIEALMHYVASLK